MSNESKVHPVVTVSVPAGIANDLKVMQRVTANVLGKLGCPACHSGFDIRFRQDLAFFATHAGEVMALHEIGK